MAEAARKLESERRVKQVDHTGLEQGVEGSQQQRAHC